MIKIGKPYIKEMEDETVRLCSIVNYNGKNNEIWYGVSRKYAQYLCFERADAFLLAFLPYAMAFKHDIKVEGALSERLYYQLHNYYLPAMEKFSNYYKSIKIKCDILDSTDFSSKACGVGTGFSAGVDSFYTVLKHLNNPEESFALTHLTFFKVGATGSFGGKKADNTFIHRINQFKSFADLVNLPFLTVDSNISEHACMSFNYIHTYRTISVVLALQKLFHVYYYSSSTTIGDFSFNVVAAGNFDFFSLNCFAVEGMALFSSGLECERLEKQDYIKEFKETYNFLNVCNTEADNCSRCEKCIRTMVGFDCLGALDKYRNVLDVNYYNHHKGKCLGLLMGKKYDGTAEGNVDASLVKEMRHRGIKIPISAYFHAVPVVLRSIAFKTARSIKPIRRWYHKKMNEKLGCNYNDE